jgi:hypothetical protein
MTTLIEDAQMATATAEHHIARAGRALAADRLLASYAVYADRVAVRAELHKATVELLRAIKAIESCPEWPTQADQ